MTEPQNDPAARRDTVSNFSVRTRFDGFVHVVELAGELDIASRASALRACTPPHHLDVVVDLASLRFMDCAGYGALIAAASTLDLRGGSLAIRHPVGGPLRLLTLLDESALGMTPPKQRHEFVVSPTEAIAS